MAKAIKLKETPVTESEVETVPETVIEEKAEVTTESIINPVVEEKPKVAAVVKDERTIEEKILDFVESRGNVGEIKMNDFLKSLYPILPNTPPDYLQLGKSKELKKTLTDMQAAGNILIVNNAHLKLGQPYHEGVQQESKNHTILTVPISVKKIIL